MSATAEPGSGDGLRRFAEKPPENRTEAQRDRDRILYTSAFQRLAGITQIAAAEAGQVIHNRLTHSLKVSQVARRLAQRLGRDAHSQETVAAAALAHDFGHPPFGHIAELKLNELASSWGGFEGNAQSFRIVNTLALRDPAYRGLNLTAPTLNAMLKYPWLRNIRDQKKSDKWGSYEQEKPAFEFARVGCVEDERSVEAEIMDWADDVTYAVHDLEDFHRLGLIPLDRLVNSSDERDRFFESFFEQTGGRRVLRGKFASFTEDDLRAATEFVFIQTLGEDVTPYRGAREERIYIRSRTSYLIGWFVRAVTLDGDKVKIDSRRQAEIAVLKELAWFYVIADPSLATLQHGQRRVISDLHGIYCDAVDDPKRWHLFPLAQQELLRIREGDYRRVATDFVAGLTEDLAYELHQRLTGVSRGSILDAAARASR